MLRCSDFISRISEFRIFATLLAVVYYVISGFWAFCEGFVINRLVHLEDFVDDSSTPSARGRNGLLQRMSFAPEHPIGPWEANGQTAGEMAGYPGPGDISAAYGGLWESHHCLTGQSPGLAAHYPDILAGFTPDLVWSSRQPCGQRLSTSSRSSSNGLPTQNGGPGSTNSSSSHKKTRRRVATVAQRRAANIRERRRMFNLNEAFDKLRRKVPTFAYEKRLSRIETLRLAITYISFMAELLHGQHATSNGGAKADIFHHHHHSPPREYIPYSLLPN